jgi:hypothetical protein
MIKDAVFLVHFPLDIHLFFFSVTHVPQPALSQSVFSDLKCIFYTFFKYNRRSVAYSLFLIPCAALSVVEVFPIPYSLIADFIS